MCRLTGLREAILEDGIAFFITKIDHSVIFPIPAEYGCKELSPEYAMINSIRYCPVSPESDPNPPDPKTGVGRKYATGDRLSLSGDMAFFNLFGLAPASRTTAENGGRLSFSLRYTQRKTESLSIDGAYSASERTFSAEFSYRFMKTSSTNGKTEVSLYQLDFSLSASRIESASARPFDKPEDIMEFVRRFADEVIDAAHDPKRKLTGVIFSTEDFAEIAAIDKGRLAALIMNLITTTILLEQWRHAADRPGTAKSFVLRMVRQHEKGIRIEASTQTSLSLSMNFIELRRSIRNGSPASPSPAQPVAEKPAPPVAPDPPVSS